MIVSAIFVLLSGAGSIVLGNVALSWLGGTSGNASGSQPSQPPPQIGTTTTLRQYVVSNPNWLDTPTTFAARLRITLDEQATEGHPAAVSLNATGTDLEAHSVEDLAQNGADISGVVMVVGRVRTVSASPVTWTSGGHETRGPKHDAVLEAPDKRSVIFGLIAGKLRRGQIVYFPGVVVAVGDTKSRTATAYVVSVSAALTRVPTSGAIQVLIKAYLIALKQTTSATG